MSDISTKGNPFVPYIEPKKKEVKKPKPKIKGK